MIVHTCAENIHIRMRLLQGLQTLRRSDNAQELYTARVTLFALADGINGAAAARFTKRLGEVLGDIRTLLL